MKILRWLWDYGILVGIFAIGVFAWIARISKKTPRELTETRLELINETARVKKELAEKGADIARQSVELRYKEKLESMNEQQREQAKALSEDPVALARFLVCVGRKS